MARNRQTLDISLAGLHPKSLSPILAGALVWLSTALLLVAAGPAAADSGLYFDTRLDADGNGVEDILDGWLSGRLTWPDLRQAAVAGADAARLAAEKAARAQVDGPEKALWPDAAPPALADETGPWVAGKLRLICLGRTQEDLDRALVAARAAGDCTVLQSLDRFGGVTVLAGDEAGLAALLRARSGGRFLLDRDGVPALDTSRGLVGGGRVSAGFWRLGQDWSGTVAVLDSGCDTAHGDLGDAADDDIDGPPPAVGDAADWYPADAGWPVYAGYKVVGWQDVTDDFPLAAGPWDYHHHGTALASVACGAGNVDPAYRGLAPQGRLTVVKYYDFDGIWHAWAGDFLAACAWTLDHVATYRIRVALMAVNWETDAGISTALDALLEAGVVPVAAMGNFGLDAAGPGYPALVPGVLTVGGVDDAGAVAAFSGRGLGAQAKPDLLAPSGGLLIASGRITAADNEPQDTYSGRRGTSLAAAHVAGAVYLLTDAMRQNGIPLPTGRDEALLLAAVLKATSARVDEEETPDGLGTTALPAQSGPDDVRGWGLLRVDAAVDALLRPLLPGKDQVDTLLAGWEHPVVARRLQVNNGIRYQVEAVPAVGLDVALEVIDPAWVVDDGLADQIQRKDENGTGVSEFAYVHGAGTSWLMVVVKRVSGAGTVTLRLREADSFPDQGVQVVLPGVLTGAPNHGTLAGSDQEVLVIPSRVALDQVGRSVNVHDTAGVVRPGWPVYLFPHSSALGGLNQPLLWDLDGEAGDEIVLSSAYGSVYFFASGPDYTEVELAFNRPLTAPVGLTDASEQRRVAVVDQQGRLRIWSDGPVLEQDLELAHVDPLQPAVGDLVAAAGEEMVVTFADGNVQALAADGTLLPGWPITLAETPAAAPVLCDVDNDGRHDILQPVLNAGGALVMRILGGDGLPLPADGAVMAPRDGGSWLQISPPAVVGRYGTGDLRVVLTALQDNGQTGQDVAWSLSRLSSYADGTTAVTAIPGFGFSPLAPESILSLESAILPAPVAWNIVGGTGTDPAALACIHWRDHIFGVTSAPGCALALFQPADDDLPLTVRRPFGLGGRQVPGVVSGGLMVMPLLEDVLLLAVIVEDEVSLMPVSARTSTEPLWSAARADARNTGAYPLYAPTASLAQTVAPGSRLAVWPNPGSGAFHFSLSGEGPEATELTIYDLRGRRVRQLTAPPTAGLGWDGRDADGRAVAAGTYLVQARRGARQATARVVVTR